MILDRVAWASVAVIAALASFSFLVAAGTIALASFIGVMWAIFVMGLALAGAAGGAIVLSLRAPDGEEKGSFEQRLFVRTAQDLIRAQPLSAIALCGAAGYAAARHPVAAAEIGRGAVKLAIH